MLLCNRSRQLLRAAEIFSNKLHIANISVLAYPERRDEEWSREESDADVTRKKRLKSFTLGRDSHFSFLPVCVHVSWVEWISWILHLLLFCDVASSLCALKEWFFFLFLPFISFWVLLSILAVRTRYAFLPPFLQWKEGRVQPQIAARSWAGVETGQEKQRGGREKKISWKKKGNSGESGGFSLVASWSWVDKL